MRWIAEAGYRGEHAAIEGALAPHSGADRHFLDFGCGTGQFAACFPACRYVGIDPARPYVDYAIRHRTGNYSVMDGGALGLLPERFDGVLVLGVLHHLPDEIARSSLDELERVLRPGGTLLVIEDVPPPTLLNVPGHVMHWLDRGGHIRDDEAYRALFAPYFEIREHYTMRSGICDYGVYVLAHRSAPRSP